MPEETNDARLAECPDENACELVRIEVEFAIPIFMTQDQQRRLVELLDEIVRAPWNQLAEGVHWISGIGAKPRWSRADAAFLGKTATADAPESGEPDFELEVFHIESTAREFVSNKEREREMLRREMLRRAEMTPLGSLPQRIHALAHQAAQRHWAEHRDITKCPRHPTMTDVEALARRLDSTEFVEMLITGGLQVYGRAYREALDQLAGQREDSDAPR